jgi:hypothetical protein
VIVRCGPWLDPARVAEIAHSGTEYGIPLIADVSDIASFFQLQSVKNWCEMFDALLIGSWISAGLPIGVLVMRQSFLRVPGVLDALYSNEAILAGDGFPPNYKLRAVQRCAADLDKRGHQKALLEKYARFCGSLDMSIFESVGGLIYLKNRRIPHEEYGHLRLKCLQGGIILPRRSTMNLSISFAHSDELLARCARGLNRLLSRTH